MNQRESASLVRSAIHYRDRSERKIHRAGTRTPRGYVFGGQMIGIGAGQQSRVDCTKLAGSEGRPVVASHTPQAPRAWLQNRDQKRGQTNVDKQRGTILVVDDNVAIRSFAKAFLENAGYRVATAADGQEGLSFFRQHQSSIAMLLTDVSIRT